MEVHSLQVQLAEFASLDLPTVASQDAFHRMIQGNHNPILKLQVLATINLLIISMLRKFVKKGGVRLTEKHCFHCYQFCLGQKPLYFPIA